MNPQVTTTSDPLLDAVSAGVRLVELGQPFFTGMPCSPNHPGFRMTLIRRHGDMVRPDGGSAANEIIVTGGHVGTHVDALSHVSHDGLMYGGVDAAQSQLGGSFRELGAEHIPAFLSPRRPPRRRRHRGVDGPRARSGRRRRRAAGGARPVRYRPAAG